MCRLEWTELRIRNAIARFSTVNWKRIGWMRRDGRIRFKWRRVRSNRLPGVWGHMLRRARLC